MVNITSMNLLNYEDTHHSLSWHAPMVLSNNDPNMLVYLIEWCDSMTCSMDNTTQLMYTILNLSPGTSYNYTITVQNEYMQLSSVMAGTFTTEFCPSFAWKCLNSTVCVNTSLLCDGTAHCADGSDESSNASCCKYPLCQ